MPPSSWSAREAGVAQAATAKQPPASAPHLKLWTVPSAQKVFREDDHAGTNPVTLHLEAAANEAEASQLVLRVTGGDVVLTNAAVAEFTPQYGVTLRARPAVRVTFGLRHTDIIISDNRTLPAAVDYVGNLGGGVVEIGLLDQGYSSPVARSEAHPLPAARTRHGGFQRLPARDERTQLMPARDPTEVTLTSCRSWEIVSWEPGPGAGYAPG